MIGQIISHYKITEKLGAGGMGVLYKAEDTKLKRTVALKFLPPALSADKQAKTRFIHEAQAASALDHPNICTIYEIGETDDGQSFIAMACYDGQSLKDKIAGARRDGTLAVNEALDIIIQIAKGLARAHEEGIVHRDIKPANIMITGRGEVKILDFGLAKLAGQSRLTKTGSTVGTIAYMAPEQVRGDAVDHRTDIWSLGVVMYEMLTGQLPFKGDYEPAMIYSIINEEPDKPGTLNDEIPPELEQIISRCLAKNPADRYPAVEEMLLDFKPFSVEATITIDESVSGILKRLWRKKKVKRIGTISLAVTIVILIGIYFSVLAPSGRIDSLAILPFVNTSGNEEAEYLSSGIPESIISDLQKIPDIRLASFSSLLYRYKDKSNDPMIVGREMNVESVVMGRLSLIGEDVNINIEIIDTRENRVLLAREYIEKLKDLFEIKTKIARDITAHLPFELSEEEVKSILPARQVDPLAYQYYLKGREYTYRRNPESLNKAIFYFNKALGIDSTYALAWSGLADTYSYQPMYTGTSWNRIRPKLIHAAHKAFELDSTLAETRTSISAAYEATEQYEKEVQELKKALSINPGYFQASQWLAYTLINRLGNYEEGIQVLKNALKIDPFEPMISGLLALAYIWSGQTQKAEGQIARNLEYNPGHAHTYFAPVYLLNGRGQKEEAVKMAQKAVKLDSTNFLTNDVLASAYEMTGSDDQAIAHYQKMIRQDSGFAYWANMEIARIYLKLGNFDQALSHCLESIGIDPLSEEAHQRLGKIYIGMRDYRQALSEFSNSIKISPNNPSNYRYYLNTLSVLGRYHEAVDEAVRLSTLDENHHYNMGLIYICSGEHSKAIAELQKYVQKKNPVVDSYYWLGNLHLMLKEFPEAIKNIQFYLTKSNIQQQDSCDQLVFGGNPVNEFSARDYIICIIGNIKDDLFRAVNYSLLGDIENAFEMLEKAEKNKNRDLPVYIKTAFFDSLKSDSRYAVLLKNLKLDRNNHH